MRPSIFAVLGFALSAAVLAQAPAPTPAPTPGAATSKEDAVPRARKEPAKEETSAAKTGKGTPAAANAEAPKKGGWNSGTLAGLELRSIGPAVTSGRIIDLAVDPTNSSRWFVASADGGVWRTVNAGTTFQPVFDSEASHSIWPTTPR